MGTIILNGLFIVYGGWKFLVKPSFYIALILSLVLFFFLLFSTRSANSILNLITKINELGLDLDGGLIGLTLAGLTLIVTFGSDRLMKQLIKGNLLKAIDEEKKPGFSAYQTTVSKFGFAVFVQIITLIFLFVINLFIELNLTIDSESICKFLNCLFLSLEFFLIVYSLFLVVQMTLNIYTISQMNHSVYFSDITLEIMTEMDKKKEKS
ncbi:MAG: hypothetical protein FGM14_04675 [Flavobacteriales bacterium]|nr:hypothetical protein [Flavobacteriales bacterium]